MNKEERKNEAIRKYELHNNKLKELTKQSNEEHHQRELARAEYESITGKDIGTRFEPK